MPKAKQKKLQVELPREMPDIIPQPILPPVRKNDKKFLFLGILILGLVGLFITNKGLLFAAVVNGRPIFRWDLNKVMTQRFGQQTLEGMISEMLIADEASKANVSVSAEEVGVKQKEILRSLGGNVNLDDLLKYQGMTKQDFDDQIKLQLTVQKLLGKDIQITESDIDNYIATNRAQLTATEPAVLRQEAKSAILDQKVSEKIQPWFAEIKQKAQILRYL